MIEPAPEEPPEPPRAADFIAASDYLNGAVRWVDLGSRAQDVVRDWGEAPPDDPPEDEAPA